MHVIGHMLFGLVVGIVAKILMPGQHPGGVIVTMLLGILGAWLGGLAGRALGLYPKGHAAGFVMAVIGAMLVLLIYGYVTGPSRGRVTASPVRLAFEAQPLRTSVVRPL
jgi:uncharacterized membrane protein YeaQ/YmgE (transglycosylase-associated protein family)